MQSPSLVSTSESNLFHLEDVKELSQNCRTFKCRLKTVGAQHEEHSGSASWPPWRLLPVAVHLWVSRFLNYLNLIRQLLSLDLCANFVRGEISSLSPLDTRFKCSISCSWTIPKSNIYLHTLNRQLWHIFTLAFLISFRNDDVVYFDMKTIIMWWKKGKLRIPKLNNICCVFVCISIFLIKNTHT